MAFESFSVQRRANATLDTEIEVPLFVYKKSCCLPGQKHVYLTLE